MSAAGPELADALVRGLGAGVVEGHAPVALDGAQIGITLHPGDGDALAAALALLAREGLAAVPRGAGRHLALGNPPRRADLFLSTRGLAGVDAFEPAEGVCHAAAGTPLGVLRETVAAGGWEPPLDAPDDATLGGVLAAGVLGPRAHGFGPPRDAVLGLEVVTGEGARTRCGGRVVKNVTGYDLAKLYTGSLGSLGVFEGVWLRLRPVPERVSCWGAEASGVAEGCALALRAARLATTRACALHGSAASGFACAVELAGDAAAVAADEGRLGAAPREAGDLADLPSSPPADAGGDALAVRIAALPTEQPDVLEPLVAAGARVAAQPGLRLVQALFEAATPAALEAADAAAARASGPLRIERAPTAVKRGRDVFGADPTEARLLAALKARLDPRGVLSPGRFAGRA